MEHHATHGTLSTGDENVIIKKKLLKLVAFLFLIPSPSMGGSLYARKLEINQISFAWNTLQRMGHSAQHSLITNKSFVNCYDNIFYY